LLQCRKHKRPVQVLVVNKEMTRMCHSRCHTSRACEHTVTFLRFRFAVQLQHSINGDRTLQRQICIQNKAACREGHWDTNLPLQPLLYSLCMHTHTHALSLYLHTCTSPGSMCMCTCQGLADTSATSEAAPH